MINLDKKLTVEDIKKQGAEFLFENKKFAFYEIDNWKYIVDKKGIVAYSFKVNDSGLKKYEIMDRDKYH